MKNKVILLFLALAVPGLIFIFLKQCGKNEFAIPVYYAESADSLNAACGTHYGKPYQVPDSVLLPLGWDAKKATMFFFDEATPGDSEFRRVVGSFNGSEFQMIGVYERKVGAEVLARWSSCVFMLRQAGNIVLMDREKRIRGYYLTGSREEADRLILEMEILLKKY